MLFAVRKLPAQAGNAGAAEDEMPELMLLSNSFAPGRGTLEHAMEELAVFFVDSREVLFVYPVTSSRATTSAPCLTPFPATTPRPDGGKD